MYSERAFASSALAKTSTTAPPSAPVSPGVPPLSVIQAADVYWLGRPKSLLVSRAAVTVVILVMLATFGLSAVATEVASAATVGVGVGLGASVVAVGAEVCEAEAGAEDWVDGAEQPARRNAATPSAAMCLRINQMIGPGWEPAAL